MSRDNYSRGKNRGNWNNNNRNNQKRNNNHNDRSERNDRQDRNKSFERRSNINQDLQKQFAENEEAIREFKSNVPVCEICGEPITDLASAINNKGSMNPVHFDCVLNKLSEQENPGPNEKVTYIGNGKFAVLHFENVHDMRHFSIIKEIEWENRDAERGEWRNTYANLYSKVK